MFGSGHPSNYLSNIFRKDPFVFNNGKKNIQWKLRFHLLSFMRITSSYYVSLYTIIYTIHYILSTLHYTLYTIHHTLYSIHYTLYTLHCIIIYYTLINYTLYSFKLYTIHYTLYTV